MEVDASVRQGVHHPAPLALGQGGGEGPGLHRQLPAAPQGLAALAAEAEGNGSPAGGDADALGRGGQLPAAVQGVEGQLLGQGVAQEVVLLVQRRHLPLQGGAELGVDQHVPAHVAGQGSDEDHAAKELPEEFHSLTAFPAPGVRPPAGSPPCRPPPAGFPIPASSASAGCGGPPCGCPPGTPRPKPAHKSGPGTGRCSYSA